MTTPALCGYSRAMTTTRTATTATQPTAYLTPSEEVVLSTRDQNGELTVTYLSGDAAAELIRQLQVAIGER